MKIKGFDKFQQYSFAKLYENMREGKDVAGMLETYAMIRSYEHAVEWAEKFNELLREKAAADPAPSAWRSFGYVCPIFGAEPVDVLDLIDDTPVKELPLAIAIPGTLAVVLCVEKREKILPSQTLRDATTERVRKFEEREQTTATKKDWAVLKDEVEARLLKSAPVRRSRFNVVMDRNNVFVFTASSKAAEDAVAMIRSTISSFPVVPVYGNEFALREFFADIVKREGEELCKAFHPGWAGAFKNDEGTIYTIKDEDLDDEGGSNLLATGYHIRQMIMRFKTGDAALKDAFITMTLKGDIKSIQLTGTVDEASEGGHEDYASDFGSMYDRDNAYVSRIAELWLLLKMINAFDQTMTKLGQREEVDMTLPMHFHIHTPEDDDI